MVRLGYFAAAAAMIGSALCAPAQAAVDLFKRDPSSDITILQFALTLEHLENVFYKQALKKFSVEDFEKAGYTADYYNDLHYIAYDEQSHVVLLEQAIRAAGATPVKACTYTFPYTDVPSFITLSSILENVGTSAYLGAAPLIISKQYLTVAGSILAVEALHTSLQRLAIGEVPMANPLETPLDGNSVYTLASMFIVSCPASNAPLPFTAFPYLTTDGKTCSCEEPSCGNPTDYLKKRGEPQSEWSDRFPDGWKHQYPYCTPPSAGAPVTFTADGKIPAGSYVTFVNGLIVTSVKGTVSGSDITAKIPTGVSGQTYVFVTKSDVETTFSDSAVLFGPAILEVKPPAPTLNYNILKA